MVSRTRGFTNTSNVVKHASIIFAKMYSKQSSNMLKYVSNIQDFTTYFKLLKNIKVYVTYCQGCRQWEGVTEFIGPRDLIGPRSPTGHREHWEIKFK